MSKRDLVCNIENILSYLLSRKHEVDVKIVFKKEQYEDEHINTSRDIGKEQTLD